MKHLWQIPFYWVLRFLFWLRYRIEVVGLDEIVKSGDKGTLFLPNHPALIDPVLVLIALWPKFHPRPMILDEYYKRFKVWFDAANVISIPTLDTVNKGKAMQIDKAMQTIVSCLDKGDNFLIYPSGRIKRQPLEKVGSASFVFDLLRLRPQCSVVLVRTTGLWGSSFSAAPTKQSPNMEKTLLQGMKTLLKNGIFFTPRRRVKIELQRAPEGMPRGNNKMELNQFLEYWYNLNGPEKEVRVPYHFWKKGKSKWPREKERPATHILDGKTIQEVFLHSCDRMSGFAACGDNLSGVLSYRKLKMAALILSAKIKEMPGDNIGILLPSSVGAFVTILATLLADKIPVMLNWTTGVRNLEHAVDLCSIQTILSSERFLQRAGNIDLGKNAHLLLPLEKVRKSISLLEKLKGVLASFQSADELLHKLNLKTDENDPAVIIFTSGTETLPKGVPLSHRNVLSNQRAALKHVELTKDDIFYSVLPPFHSFGFAVTGLLPLLAGIRTRFAPDPTKARSMATDIEEWQATVFCCAPTFIRALLHVAKEGQLRSLRLVVSGAEKAPQELFKSLNDLHITFLEGYGVSECSPIVTINLPGKPPNGVGYPIEEVKLCVIDPDKGTLLPGGGEGEVCIGGPGVFSGYIGTKKDPFIMLEGTKWYRSGDRGYLDPAGALILTGRMTRFVKIGGEMVSLGGLEEDLLGICRKAGWLPEHSELPQLAIGVQDREGEKPLIVLFAVAELSRDELNRALKELGYGAIMKISEVRKIDHIPVTATGKVQYRALDDLIMNG